MGNFLKFDKTFIRIQLSACFVMLLFLVIQMIDGTTDPWFMICMFVLLALTLLDFLIFHLLKGTKEAIYITLKVLSLLASAVMIYSEVAFIFGMGILNYMLYAVELFLTKGVEAERKSTMYWLILTPFVTVTLLIGYISKDYGVFFFVALFIVVILGIYHVILLINDQLVEEIDNAEALFNESKEKNLRLEKSQSKLRQVYETMSEQKFLLETTNKRLNKVSAEMYIQNELLKYISQTLDIEQLLDLVTDSILGAIGTDTCSLLIYKDVTHTEYYVEAKSTVDPEATGHLMALIDAGEMHQYMEQRDAIIDGDVTEGEYIFSGERMIGSLIMIPLVRDDEVYGLLYAEHHQKDYFQDSTLEFFNAIATQINIAVNNASIYLRMEEMAKIDSLTQIYNRRTFQDLLVSLYRSYSKEQKPFSVVLFDIDYFKKINDTYGHLFGDHAIQMVAGVAKAYAKKYHGFAGRYGGEEFVIVIPDKTKEQIYGIMALMHEEIKQTTLHYDGEPVYIDISLGITNYPEFGENAEDLLNRADHAMYYAKDHGRGRIQMDDDSL